MKDPLIALQAIINKETDYANKSGNPFAALKAKQLQEIFEQLYELKLKQEVDKKAWKDFVLANLKATKSMTTLEREYIKKLDPSLFLKDGYFDDLLALKTFNTIKLNLGINE